MQKRARREEEERCSDGTIRSSRRLRTRAPIDTGTDSSRMQQQKKAAPPSRSRHHIRKSGRYEGRFRPKTKVQYVSKWRVIRNGYRGFSNGFHRSVHVHQYFFFSPLCCLYLHCMYTYCGTCPLPMMEVSVSTCFRSHSYMYVHYNELYSYYWLRLSGTIFSSSSTIPGRRTAGSRMFATLSIRRLWKNRRRPPRPPIPL